MISHSIESLYIYLSQAAFGILPIIQCTDKRAQSFRERKTFSLFLIAFILYLISEYLNIIAFILYLISEYLYLNKGIRTRTLFYFSFQNNGFVFIFIFHIFHIFHVFLIFSVFSSLVPSLLTLDPSSFLLEID